MKYCKTVVVASFVIGYAVKSFLAPSTAGELYSALEKKLTKDPMKYEQVIDQTRELATQLKSEANPHPTKQGYVQFKDLRLVLKEEQDGNLTVLVNKHTTEEQEIKYINGRTTVGVYEERLESVKYETLQRGKEIVIETKKKVEQKAKGFRDDIKEKLDGAYEKAKEFKDDIMEELDDTYNRFRDLLPEDGSKEPALQIPRKDKKSNNDREMSL